jgi:hypothetical protein
MKRAKQAEGAPALRACLLGVRDNGLENRMA